MKKIILISVVIVVLLFLTGNIKFSNSNKQKDNNDNFEPPKPPSPINNGLNDSTTPTPYYTNEGEGLDAVNSTMRSVFENNYQMFAYGISTDLYSGMSHKAGVKAAMVSIFGNSRDIPLVPKFQNPSVSAQMKDIIESMGFEEMTGLNDRETTNVIPHWQSMLDFGSFSLWPIDIAEMIEAEYFGKPKRGDRNRSERYDAFINDIKILAKNYLLAIDEIEIDVRREAIKRLQSTGWNFVDVV